MFAEIFFSVRSSSPSGDLPARRQFRPRTRRDEIVIGTSTMILLSDISKEMAIDTYDIVSTFQALGMMKYWKGKHIILKKQVGALLLL